jgi:hypothetical protein
MEHHLCMVQPIDIQAWRRANLAAVIEQRFGGKQAALIDQIDINQGELSGLLSGKKNFGEKKARSLEILIGMPSGSLDLPPGTQPDGPSVMATVFAALPEGDQEVLLDYVHVLLTARGVIFDGPKAKSYVDMVNRLRADMKRRQDKT